ncbi:hypothetical protein [Rhodovulum steppense]|uniref:Uncharacterized protein n=1 Tax=Rhodovulum steppense TaxID=540251 RepID=A0A4R1YM73_9RHOB|nr:hypothetical protein [Rhodovulum steppense]TCM78333.1 hypothetical protein EV216_1268 [Rhodovulum steppense]
MTRKKKPAADPAEARALRDAGLSAVRARRLALLRAVARAGGVETSRVPFSAYVAARPHTDDPRGDFTTDFRLDRGKPDVRTLADLRAYLRRRRACAEAITAGASVWREFESVIRDALECETAREMASRAVTED